MLRFFVGLFFLFVTNWAQASAKSILVLHSYDMTYGWTLRMNDGIMKGLERLPPELHVYAEFLDAQHYRKASDFEAMAKILEAKHGRHKFKAVLTTDDDAFNFYLKYYDRLFQGSTLFFSGKGTLDLAALKTHPGIVRGVMEYMPIVKNLHLGRKLHQTSTVYFISDASTTGIAQEAHWRQEFTRLVPDMNVVYLSLRDMSHRELYQRVSELRDGFIQLNVIGEDKDGVVLDNIKNTETITQLARIPVYSESSLRMGHGVIGGFMKDPRLHGESAALKLVSYMLGSDDPPAIVPAGETIVMFDYNVLQRFGVDLRLLPPEAIIIDRPPNKYSVVVWALGGLLGVALLVIFLQAIRIQSRRRFNEKLSEQVASKTKELQFQILEQKRLQTVMVLKEKLASLGLLTAGIAHEIKNPLNIILNSALSIDRKLTQLDNQELAAELQRLSHFIVKNTRRADSIIMNMLGQARNENSKPQLTSIDKLIEEAIGLVYHSCKTRYANVPEVKTDLQTSTPLLVVRENMLRVFINLLENSFYSVNQKLKTCQENCVPVLRVASWEDEAFCYIEFFDNGVGVPREMLERIWLPFFSTKPVGEGSGLGLSMVYDIITSHNGDITIESQIEEFALFKLKLPKRSALPETA
ncbi:MAG: ATP-binding protein [Bacteriovoracia bacterium]